MRNRSVVQAAPPPIGKRSRLGMPRWVPAAVWGSLIFASSCTVVHLTQFLVLVGKIAPAPLADRFSAFYLVYWLLVVKSWHMTEFALLFLFVRRALTSLGGEWTHRALPLAAGSCILFAASDEWHQTFVPGRGGVWTDVVIDSCGVLLAAYASWLFQRDRTPMSTNRPAAKPSA